MRKVFGNYFNMAEEQKKFCELLYHDARNGHKIRLIKNGTPVIFSLKYCISISLLFCRQTRISNSSRSVFKVSSHEPRTTVLTESPSCLE